MLRTDVWERLGTKRLKNKLYKIYVFAAILALPLPGGCRHMGKGLPRTVTSQSTANHLFELPCPSTAFSQANFGGPPCVILAEKSLDIFSQFDREGSNLVLFYYATTGSCSPFRGSSVSPPQEFDWRRGCRAGGGEGGGGDWAARRIHQWRIPSARQWMHLQQISRCHISSRHHDKKSWETSHQPTFQLGYPWFQ